MLHGKRANYFTLGTDSESYSSLGNQYPRGNFPEACSICFITPNHESREQVIGEVGEHTCIGKNCLSAELTNEMAYLSQ